MNEPGVVRNVQAGKPFSIDLEAIPGAGYLWQLAGRPEEVALVSEDVVSVSKEIGGNAVQRFTLVAHRPGTFTLTFELKRRWQKTAARTMEIPLHVQ